MKCQVSGRERDAWRSRGWRGELDRWAETLPCSGRYLTLQGRVWGQGSERIIVEQGDIWKQPMMEVIAFSLRTMKLPCIELCFPRRLAKVWMQLFGNGIFVTTLGSTFMTLSSISGVLIRGKFHEIPETDSETIQKQSKGFHDWQLSPEARRRH